MHGDIKESDGLCGSTRQSLSGQLNIRMRVYSRRRSDNNHMHKCLIPFSIFSPKQT